MRILVTGADGMVGRKLTERLVLDGSLGGRPIDRLTLADLVPPEGPERPAFGVDVVEGDIADPRDVETLVADRPDVMFHLAAVVSGEAEADFEKGYRVNLDGTRPCSSHPRGSATLPSSGRLRVLDRSLRRAVPRGDR